MPTKEEKKATYTLVYVGRRVIANGGIAYAYTTLGAPEQDEESIRLWKKTLYAGAPVGSILEVEGPEDKGGATLYTNRTKFVRSLEEEDVDWQYMAGWVADDRAAAIHKEEKTLLRKAQDGHHNPLDDAIAVLRETYHKQVGWNRKAALLKYIEEGVTR